MNNKQKAINSRIRQILDAKQWKDKALAEGLGMSKATLSQRFSEANWKIDELMAVADLTGYSLYWICEGHGPELEKDHMEAIENYKMDDNFSVAAEPSQSHEYDFLVRNNVTQLNYIERLEKENADLKKQLSKGKKSKL